MKLFRNSLLMGVLSMLLFACNDDDAEQKVNVKFIVTPVMADAFDASHISKLKATFTDMRNRETTVTQLDDKGTAIVALYKGTYNVSIEDKQANADGEDIVYSVKMENVTIAADQQEVKADLHTSPAKATGTDFIFSEVFFNGETNSGIMMHPDQYMVLFNPTQEVLYADGLCIGMTWQLSCLEKETFYDEYMNAGKIPSMGFMTIPGDGEKYPVNPGDRFVIAFTAIDHSKTEGYENAVDLSGADFEIYFPDPDSKDQDNPEVPNVLITDLVYLHPRGFYAPFIFRLENGTKTVVEKFYADNTREYVAPDGSKEPLFSVPADKVLDGVVTGHVPTGIVTRTLPTSVDRGFFLVSGCHRQELCIRKQIKVGAQTFYQDTDNSEDDFVMQKGQNSFPKNWRN